MLPRFPIQPYPWPGYYAFGRQPSYPPNDVTRMQSSAGAYPQLSQQAQQLTGRIQSDSSFAKQLRGAAQVNHKDQVKRMIQSVIKAPFTFSYTPDGLKVVITPTGHQRCASLTIFVCW